MIFFYDFLLFHFFCNFTDSHLGELVPESTLKLKIKSGQAEPGGANGDKLGQMGQNGTKLDQTGPSGAKRGKTELNKQTEPNKAK